MFGIGAHSHVWLKVLARQRIKKLVTNLQVLELFAVSEQIKTKYFHRGSPLSSCSGRRRPLAVRGAIRRIGRYGLPHFARAMIGTMTALARLGALRASQ
jgi:hypothetical protein